VLGLAVGIVAAIHSDWVFSPIVVVSG